MQKYRVLLSSRVFVDSMLFEVVLWMGRGRFLKGMNFPKTRTKIAPQTAKRDLVAFEMPQQSFEGPHNTSRQTLQFSYVAMGSSTGAELT